MKRAPEAAAETGRAAGLVLRSSRRLTQKLQLLEDEVSVFVAGMRAGVTKRAARHLVFPRRGIDRNAENCFP